MQIGWIDAQAQNARDTIKRPGPDFHYDQLGPNTTVEGRLNDLRTTRALKLAQKIGNHIDTVLRRNLRERYNRYGVKVAADGRVRVNRAERNAQTGDFRFPYIRVDDMAMEISLTKKTGSRPQIRGFSAVTSRRGMSSSSRLETMNLVGHILSSDK